jgi:hypothetical protein
MNSFWSGCLVTGMVTFLSVGMVHYFPWRQLLNRPLPAIAKYILGTLAMGIPLSCFAMTRQIWTANEGLIAAWMDVVFAGIGVGLFSLIDYVLEIRSRMCLAEGEASKLRKR